MQARSWKCLVAVVGVLAVLGAGEASAQPGPVEGTCSNYQLSPSEATVSSAGGSGTLDITWDWARPPFDGMCIANCTYASCGDLTGSVRSSASWLRGAKRGNDQVDYTVDEHDGTSSRTGTLTVAGATFTVMQEPPCPSSPGGVSSETLSFTASGGEQRVSVTGGTTCDWPVSDDQDWIAVHPSTVSGAGTVTVTVRRSIGDARSGTVTIGGTRISVSQSEYEVPVCPVRPGVTDVEPASLSFGPWPDSADVQLTN